MGFGTGGYGIGGYGVGLVTALNAGIPSSAPKVLLGNVLVENISTETVVTTEVGIGAVTAYGK